MAWLMVEHVVAKQKGNVRRNECPSISLVITTVWQRAINRFILNQRRPGLPGTRSLGGTEIVELFFLQVRDKGRDEYRIHILGWFFLCS